MPGPASRTPRSRRRRPPGAAARVALITERLAGRYPKPECALVHTSPLQLLVATILSAQCTDARVNMVTPALFNRFPDANAMAAADRAELEDLVRPTGFYRSKARAIQEMTRDVVSRFGGSIPDSMDQLVTLRGVGRKTANVILGVAFGKPGFAVDTHVVRLTHRLRLSSATDPVAIEEDICSMVPSRDWSDLGLRLILHGRQTCQARHPNCGGCDLRDICPSAGVY